jgi:HEAT repeat protein
MRSLSAAWKAVCSISVLVLLFQPLATAQQAEHDSRLDQLVSSDPAVRGAAKVELMQHPDPTFLPGLLKALPSSRGAIRDDLLEILAKYDDPGKLPVFLSLLKPFHSDNDSFQNWAAARASRRTGRSSSFGGVRRYW